MLHTDINKVQIIRFYVKNERFRSALYGFNKRTRFISIQHGHYLLEHFFQRRGQMTNVILNCFFLCL